MRTLALSTPPSLVRPMSAFTSQESDTATIAIRPHAPQVVRHHVKAKVARDRDWPTLHRKAKATAVRGAHTTREGNRELHQHGQQEGGDFTIMDEGSVPTTVDDSSVVIATGPELEADENGVGDPGV
jgi:hypothetical protein